MKAKMSKWTTRQVREWAEHVGMSQGAARRLSDDVDGKGLAAVAVTMLEYCAATVVTPTQVIGHGGRVLS